MNFTHAAPPVVESSYGNKYARIIYSDSGGGQRFVHTFINMINGDILKAGGWKAPAPNGVRGNIFEDDRGASVVNEHGSVYLKRWKYMTVHVTPVASGRNAAVMLQNVRLLSSFMKAVGIVPILLE